MSLCPNSLCPLQQSWKNDISIPTLKKLRLKGVKFLAQYHPAGQGRVGIFTQSAWCQSPYCFYYSKLPQVEKRITVQWPPRIWSPWTSDQRGNVTSPSWVQLLSGGQLKHHPGFKRRNLLYCKPAGKDTPEDWGHHFPRWCVPEHRIASVFTHGNHT